MWRCSCQVCDGGMMAVVFVFQVWVKHINGTHHADGQLSVLQRYVCSSSHHHNHLRRQRLVTSLCFRQVSELGLSHGAGPRVSVSHHQNQNSNRNQPQLMLFNLSSH